VYYNANIRDNKSKPVNHITMKNKYDSSVIFLFATGNEHLLPDEFRKKIPYSTISTWRKSDFGKYTGNEFRYLFDEPMKQLKIIHENKKMKRLLFSITRSWITLSNHLQPLLQKLAKDKLFKKQMINSIVRLKKQLGLQNRILKIIKFFEDLEI